MTDDWTMRYARAAYDAGWLLPSWLLICIQMERYGYGCPSRAPR